MVRVGVIGADRIGHVYAQAISAHAASQFLADLDVLQKNADDLAQTYGCLVKTSEDIVADPSIAALAMAETATISCQTGAPVALADVLDRGIA